MHPFFYVLVRFKCDFPFEGTVECKELRKIFHYNSNFLSYKYSTVEQKKIEKTLNG